MPLEKEVGRERLAEHGHEGEHGIEHVLMGDGDEPGDDSHRGAGQDAEEQTGLGHRPDGSVFLLDAPGAGDALGAREVEAKVDEGLCECHERHNVRVDGIALWQ